MENLIFDNFSDNFMKPLMVSNLRKSNARYLPDLFHNHQITQKLLIYKYLQYV